MEVFISHSKKDEEIARCFVDDILIGCLDFHHSEIYCTSIDGMKPKSGEDWRNSIKEALETSKVIILIITPNYKSSEICLNEMGAAWMTGKPIIPLIVEPITYKTVGILQEVKQIEKLNDQTSLDRVKDIIESIFGDIKEKAKSDRWTKKKQEFLTKLEVYLEDNEFDPPVTVDIVQGLNDEVKTLKVNNKDNIREIKRLEKAVVEFTKLKDAEDVKEVKKQLGFTNEKDEFENLLERLSTALKKFHPSIITFIYNTYAGKKLIVDFQTYEHKIEEALSRDYLNDDYEAKWYDTPEMEEVYNALLELDDFLTKVKVEVLSEIEAEYGCNIKLTNLTFWEEVINIDLKYD